MVAHELVYSVMKDGEKGVILKLDYEKAYDRVNWNFLFEVLKSRGFNDVWIRRVEKLVKDGFLRVNLNGEESSFFENGKGLRQGDPISPLLFNLVGDVFTRILHKAADNVLIKGLLQGFRENGIISLQYVDDTILFFDANVQHLRNLKCSLIWFENLSGMRINYHKSEFIPVNLYEEEVHTISHIFNCPIGSFPIKYIGIPLHHDKLRREYVQPLVDKITRKIASWKGKLLSYAVRIVLIKTCLSSIPTYLLSFIKFPKWAIKALNTHLANFLWDDSQGKHKYHLVN